MPITPYHLGPDLALALPLRKYIDLPVFLLSNVAVDIEPFTVTLFRLHYPYHGFCHTFLVGTAIGVLLALVCVNFKGVFKKLMNLVRLTYSTSFGKMTVSAIFGVWLHVLLDGFLNHDIKPFYPLASNPLYGILSQATVLHLCSFSFLLALAFYVLIQVQTHWTNS